MTCGKKKFFFFEKFFFSWKWYFIGIDDMITICWASWEDFMMFSQKKNLGSEISAWALKLLLKIVHFWKSSLFLYWKKGTIVHKKGTQCFWKMFFKYICNSYFPLMKKYQIVKELCKFSQKIFFLIFYAKFPIFPILGKILQFLSNFI